jgi:hypothetical protein
LVSVTGNGVDCTLDPSFPFVELVSVFQFVIVMVEEQVLLWCVLRMGSRWWGEPVVEWAAIVVVIIVPI